MSELPPQITVDPSESVLRYWHDRLHQHTYDAYAGVPLSKLPEDLRAYEHLLWSDRPDTVIEIGTQYGASALWFRDRLRTLQSYGLIGQPRVITLDIDQGPAREALSRADPDYERTIHLLEGDVRDAGMAEQAGELIGERCFVVEDSAHEYDTTYAALSAFASLVPTNGYFIVEDGSVDIEALRIGDDWPRGVLPALRDWLQTEQGREFQVRRELELYGITAHPNGFLQRRGEPDTADGAERGGDLAVRVDALETAAPPAKRVMEIRIGELQVRTGKLHAAIQEQGAQITHLQGQLHEHDRLNELLADAEQRLVDAENRVAGVPDLALRIADLERELEEAHSAAEDAHRQIEELDERLTRGQRVLTDVFSSPSWRLTKPLRTAKHFLSRD